MTCRSTPPTGIWEGGFVSVVWVDTINNKLPYGFRVVATWSGLGCRDWSGLGSSQGLVRVSARIKVRVWVRVRIWEFIQHSESVYRACVCA